MGIIRLKKYQCDVLITLNTEMENLKPPSGKDTAPILMSGDPELVSEF
jgi:hypothetical protein